MKSSVALANTDRIGSMTLEELRIEKDRLYIRHEAFLDFGKPIIAVDILLAATVEINELYDYCKAGYPPLSSDWVIHLWEIHPYQEPMS